MLRHTLLGAFAGSVCVANGLFAWRMSTAAYFAVSTILLAMLAAAVIGGHLDQLRSQAVVDPLTGLYNRRFLEERMAVELERAARHHLPLALLSLDLDDLRGLNDRQGHAAGDAALTMVAKAMVQCARSSDLVARVGGDEFVVLLPHTTVGRAQALADRIAANVRRMSGPWPRPLSVSIGLAPLDGESSGASQLIWSADEALRRAKASGGGRTERVSEHHAVTPS